MEEENQIFLPGSRKRRGRRRGSCKLLELPLHRRAAEQVLEHHGEKTTNFHSVLLLLPLWVVTLLVF